jgi:hypothetical protein
MTDQEAITIVEGLRRNTENPAILAVCDWVLALAQRDAVSAARRAHRNEYMKALMKRRRAQKKLSVPQVERAPFLGGARRFEVFNLMISSRITREASYRHRACNHCQSPSRIQIVIRCSW